MSFIAKTIKLLFIIVLVVLTFSACNGDKEDEPQIENLILGDWFFQESSIEIIKQPLGSEITISAPNVTGLKWSFQTNDSLYVSNTDTSFVNYYQYDSAEMKLYIDDGFYDVLKLSQDSLNLRFFIDLSVVDFEYYTYFKLTK